MLASPGILWLWLGLYPGILPRALGLQASSSRHSFVIRLWNSLVASQVGLFRNIVDIDIYIYIRERERERERE